MKWQHGSLQHRSSTPDWSCLNSYAATDFHQHAMLRFSTYGTVISSKSAAAASASQWERAMGGCSPEGQRHASAVATVCVLAGHVVLQGLLAAPGDGNGKQPKTWKARLAHREPWSGN